MPQDLIQYAVEKMAATDPGKLGIGERLQIGLKNLTRDEAAEVLLLLARLQRDRDTTNKPVRLHGADQPDPARGLLAGEG